MEQFNISKDRLIFYQEFDTDTTFFFMLKYEPTLA